MKKGNSKRSMSENGPLLSNLIPHTSLLVLKFSKSQIANLDFNFLLRNFYLKECWVEIVTHELLSGKLRESRFLSECLFKEKSVFNIVICVLCALKNIGVAIFY